MNILFFLHAPYLGGVEQMSLHLLSFLQKYSDLQVYCTLPSLSEVLQKRKISTKTINMGKKIGGQKSFFLCLLTAPFFLVKYLLILMKAFSVRKKTIIFLSTLNEKFIITPIAFFLGFKTIWIDHGPLSKWISGLPLLFYIKLSYFCSKIIAVSFATQKNLVAIGVSKKKIEVIYNGIPLQEEIKENKLKKNSKTFTIGYLNRLIPEKGPQIILESLKLLSEELRPKVEILIGGIGYYQEELVKFVVKNNLEKVVTFVGWQEQTDDFYKKLDCFINPSLYYEGFGLTILEAWKYQIPVIASKKGAFIELIEDQKNGLLFNPNDSKQLSEKIEFLLKFPFEAQKIGIEGYRTLKTSFSSEKMGQAYLNQIRLLVE